MEKNKWLYCEEVFPQLANTEDKDRYINLIKNEHVRNFTKDCLEYAGYEITDYENKIAEVLLDTLIKKELLSADNHQALVDMLLASTFLHNVYFDENNIAPSLMMARANFDHIADKYEMPETIREPIWDAIEGQLGDLTPMLKTKPSPNTPQDMLATCIWIVRNSGKWFFNK